MIFVSEGDSEAEEVLAARYLRLVRACARPLFLAGGDSEDLIQEGTFGLLSAIRRYKPDGEASFKTFAEVCVVRQMITAVKTSTRKKNSPLNHYISIHTSSDEIDSVSGKLVDSKNVNPESIVIERESAIGIKSKIDSVLSDFESEVLRYYLSGISYKKIASYIGKSPKAVDNALCRIKKKIEKYI